MPAAKKAVAKVQKTPAVKKNTAIQKTSFEEMTPSQIELIKKTVAIGANDNELGLFLHQCNKTGLDPLAKQIYCIKRGNKMSIETSIDGYRLIAARTGAYAGNDDPHYVMNGNTIGVATVTVWKIVQGVRYPFTASARWKEYVPNGNQAFMWKSKPFLMLGKCAEALALRKGFPAELSGVYLEEEMQQAGEVFVNEPVKKITPEILDGQTRVFAILTDKFNMIIEEASEYVKANLDLDSLEGIESAVEFLEAQLNKNK